MFDFLQTESRYQTYHDADTRFNVLMARQAAESSGSFVSPYMYPGPTFTVIFNNGTSRTFNNYAYVPAAYSFNGVLDGDSFYSSFVDNTVASTTGASQPTSPSIHKRNVPTGYPEPVVTHSDPAINLGGFFLTGQSTEDVAVLSINTFEYQQSSGGLEFQSTVEDFIALCKTNGKTKIIIDVSSNGGGALFLGYDSFKQVSPESHD